MRYDPFIIAFSALFLGDMPAIAARSPLKPLSDIKAEMVVFRVDPEFRKEFGNLRTIPHATILIGGDGLSDGKIQSSISGTLMRFECGGEDLPIEAEDENVIKVSIYDIERCYGKPIIFKLAGDPHLDCENNSSHDFPYLFPFYGNVANVDQLREACKRLHPVESGLAFPTKENFERIPLVGKIDYQRKYREFLIHINPHLREYYERLDATRQERKVETNE